MVQGRRWRDAHAGKKHSRSYGSQPKARIRRAWTSQMPQTVNTIRAKFQKSAQYVQIIHVLLIHAPSS